MGIHELYRRKCLATGSTAAGLQDESREPHVLVFTNRHLLAFRLKGWRGGGAIVANGGYGSLREPQHPDGVEAAVFLSIQGPKRYRPTLRRAPDRRRSVIPRPLPSIPQRVRSA